MNRFEIVALRLRAGLRQYQLAALLGVTQTALCDLERGRRSITQDDERRIRQAITHAQEASQPNH